MDIRIRLRTSYSVFTVASLALVAACGGDSTPTEMPPAAETPAAEAPAPTPAATADDVCGWLTAAENEAALGVAPGEPQPQIVEQGGCNWPPSSGDDPLVSITSRSASFDSFNDFAMSYVADTGEEPRSTEYQPVQDVGDWAMYLPDHRTLQVTVGDRTVDVTVAEPAGQEAAAALAGHIVGRLR